MDTPGPRSAIAVACEALSRYRSRWYATGPPSRFMDNDWLIRGLGGLWSPQFQRTVAWFAGVFILLRALPPAGRLLNHSLSGMGEGLDK